MIDRRRDFMDMYGSSEYIHKKIDDYKIGKLSNADLGYLPKSHMFSDEHAARILTDIPQSMAYNSRNPEHLDKLAKAPRKQVDRGHYSDLCATIARNPATKRSTIDHMLAQDGVARHAALTSRLISAKELHTHYANAKSDGEKIGIIANENIDDDLLSKIIDNEDESHEVNDYANHVYHLSNKFDD